MATFRSRHLQYYLAMLLPTLRKKKLCEMDEDLTLWVESPPLSLLVSKGFTGLMAFGTQEILSEVDAASEAPDPTVAFGAILWDLGSKTPKSPSLHNGPNCGIGVGSVKTS